ncbi:MAG: serine hydrolase domain-containing protein [Pseudomonadales bacterium]|jgi:CubicO group peptidase (beta-lactamase class C family)|nr:serine hydrolase domain-containing protein [Pseudomonadales bacterium]MDP6828663.1 serine hydrolase domain-containing protein [Pseudomonadales bacterium]|tara:strand:- start:344 stop:1516 length:1173 start_codon:yes stop_codon:yes gene_type:complete
MHERMQWYVDQKLLSCCATLVMRGTDVVDYRTFGYMDLETMVPLTPDAIYRMYSNTKIVTSVAAMMLYEEGRLGLDQPLREVLPAFADVKVLKRKAAGIDDVEELASPVLMRHILSHSAGFSYGFVEPESAIDQAYMAHGLDPLGNREDTLESMCDKLAKMPLVYQPGTSWRYSLATDVTARVVELLSGQRFDEFLKDRIFTPLSMVDTDFHVPADKVGRFITMYAPTDLLDPMKPGLVKADDAHEGQYNSPRAMLSGGGGLVSTVSDYLSFLRMIVSGGSWNGVRLLEPETLDVMRTNQLAGGIGVSFPMWDMPGTVFGLGFALKQQLSEGEPLASLGEYHWGGMAGTHSWMAPETGITGFCLTQRMPGFWHPFSHEFKRMVYQFTMGD